MKKNYILLTLLCFSISSFAQLVGTDYTRNFSDLLNRKNDKNKNLDGTPYLYDEWAEGIVVFEDDEGVKFDEVKIDLLENQLEIMYMNVEKVLPPSQFEMVKLNYLGAHENTFFKKATDLKYKGDRLNGFAEITPIGDYRVIVIHKATVFEPNTHAKVVGANGKKRIRKSQRVYLAKKKRLYRVKKKKDLLKVLTRSKKKTEAFINENNLSVKNDKDLIRILEHYQTYPKKASKK